MLNGWDNFYIMAGTAGATLIGLLFVIITLGTHLPSSGVAQGARAFLTPTLVHFGSVLFQALVVLVPWPSVWRVGVILGFCGLVGLVYLMEVVFKRRKIQFVSLHLLDWIPYAGIPALANLNLIAGADRDDCREILRALLSRGRDHAVPVRRHLRCLGSHLVDRQEP